VPVISEKIAAIYSKAEDKYFDLLDFLDSKGLPVYKYSDFFENRGLPSFVVTLALILAVLVLLTVLITYRGPDVGELILSLKDAQGNSLTNVQVKITDAKGDTLFEGTASDGEKLKLSRGLYNGEKINVSAEADGYQPASLSFTIGQENNVPKLSFDKTFEGIEAKIRLIDSETKTVVLGAVVIVTSRELSYQFIEDGNGVYKKTGVPSGTSLLLKVNAEGYTAYEDTIVFNPNQVREIQVTPSNASFVGKATVAISVKGPDGKLIEGAKVTVTNKQSNLVELSDYTRQGSVTSLLTAGVPLRIVVEKEGYLTYDSDNEGGARTIRKSEHHEEITLKQGGQKLVVSAIDAQSSFSIEGAIAQLFRMNGELIEAKETTVSGAEFNGLNPLDEIYITVQKEGYLPARQRVLVSSTEDVKVVMQRVTPENSARLDIYSIDGKGNSVNAVKVEILEVTSEGNLPSGIPLLETSLAGYANATVAREKTYSVFGYTDAFESEEVVVEITREETDEKVYLTMVKKPNIVEMVFVDIYGNDVVGSAVVSGLDGAVLFEGEIVDSRIFVDSKQKETVEVQVVLADGNTFTENVYIKGKNYVEVVVYSNDASTLSPVIEFVGIEDERGEEVKGITPGAFYWVKFNVAYPRASKSGGVHFRAGQDSVAFSESEKFGLYDLSLMGAEVSYSVSYTPEPKPGNEVVDRSNSGAQGEKNKWIEGALKEPKGSYVAKVKVRAEDFTAGRMVLKYRAWSVTGDEYYRAPQDDTLSTKPFVGDKAGLYAATNTQDIIVYESLPECNESICVTVNFVDEQEQVYGEAGFEALKEKNYALEVEINSQEQDYVQVNAYSDTVSFSSTQSGNLNFVRETGFESSEGKEEASLSASLAKDGKQKMRFYFTPKEIGSASINLSVAGKSTVEKEVLFKVVDEKTILVELSEEQVLVGRNFTVRVTDSGLKGVENALVKIIDKEGQTSKSILGDGTDGKGKTGYYRIQNNLTVGLYTVEVSLPGYKTVAVPLLITTQDVLSFPQEIEAKMPFSQKTMTLSEELINNSEFVIQSITVETQSESEEETHLGESVATAEKGKFKLNVVAPPALGKNAKQAVQITVTYLGELDDSAEENATITISGLVEGKFLAKVSAELRMIYNRQLDSSCLKIDPASVSMNLLGTEGSTDSETVEVTNSCEQEIILKARVKEKTKKSYIIVSTEDIILQAGETKNITITANNLISRANSREQTFNYEAVYDSNYLKKTINISVKIIDPSLALSYPPQITLWLAQSNPTEKATAAQPVFITNISSFPVENIQLSVGKDYASSSGIQLSIEPGGAVNLQRGQSIIPPKVLFAQANSKISEPVKGKIEITGKLGNLNNSSGQNDRYNYYENYYEGKTNLSSYAPKSSSYYTNTSQILGIIDVTAIYSGYECLKAGLVSDVASDYLFPVNGGQIGKMISIRNMCAEPVVIVGASPAGYTQQQNTIGVPRIASSIILSVPQVTVEPGGFVQVPLTVITAIPNMTRKAYQIVVNGVSQISQTPIDSKAFGINIYSGNEITDEVSRVIKVNAKICGAEENKEIEISVPNVTQKSNCGEQYCDAVGAAQYLAQKIRQTMKNAQSAGYSKANENDGFNCQITGACTFEEIGLTNEPFVLYLQNDAVTADLLYKELNKESYEGVNSTPFRETTGSTGFMVIPQIADISFLKQTVLTGYDRMVFIDSELRGCGYYKVRITGAFRATPEGLDVMTPALSVQVVPLNDSQSKRLVTKECRTSITNILNFNPIDEGLNPGKDYGTWLTTVDSDSLLKQIAKDVSNSRYKTTERVSNGSGNKVRIVYGALQGALAQACISGSEKRTITVTIDQGVSNALDEKSRNTFAQSVVKMITDTLNGAFGENCLVPNGDTYSCIKLTDTASIGKRQLVFQGRNEISFTSNSESCVEGTVYSNIPEALNFEINTISPSATGKDFANVKKLSVYTDDSKRVPNAVFKTDTQLIAQNTNNSQNGGSTVPENTIASNNTTPQNTTPAGGTTPTGTQNPGQPFGESAVAKEYAGAVRISFAEEQKENQSTETQNNNPPALAESTNNLNIQSGEVYSMTFNGGLLRATTASQTIVLLPNPTSKQYKFYRNIKVCASPNDDSGSNIGTSAYLLANGVQFEVSLVKKSTGETQDAKQIITILTGTIHPQDLISKFLNNELQKGNVYKFVPMWQGEPNAINLKLYYELITNQGKLDSLSGGGDAKTAKDKSTETDARAKSILRYIEYCVPTALACNLVTDGPIAAAFSATLDCATPLYGPLKEDAMTTSWGKGLLKGTQAAFNFVGGIVEKVVGIFGFKPDISINLTSTDIEARTLSLEQTPNREALATEWGTDIGLWGAAGGAAAEFGDILRPKYFTAISNNRSISYVAGEVADSYAKAAERMITESTQAAWMSSNSSLVNKHVRQYKAYVKEQVEAAMRTRLNAAWERKWLGLRYANPGMQMDVQTALSEGLKESKTGFRDYLSKTGSRGVTNAQDLFGSLTGTEASKAFKSGPIADSVKRSLGIVPDDWTKALTEKLKATGMFDADGVVREGVTVDRAKLQGVIDNFVDDVGKGLDDATKTRLKSAIAGAVPPTGYAGKATSLIGTGKGARTVVTGGSSVGEIVSDLSSTSRKQLASAMNAKKLGSVADEVAQAMGKSTDNILGEVSEGLAKNKWSMRARSLFSLKTLKLVAYSAACGYLAPQVGMYGYGEAIKDYKKQDSSRVGKIGSDIIAKGEVYKAVVDEFEGTLLIYSGKEILDKERENGVEKTIPIMSPVVDGKTPEQRGIGVQMLRTSRNAIWSSIARNDNDYLEYYLNGDSKKIQESVPMQRYQNEKLQELVYRYTATKTLNCEAREPAVKDTAGYGALIEPMAFAIATTRAASESFTASMLNSEYKGKTSWLKTKLEKAVEARVTVDNTSGSRIIKLDIEAAKKIFPEANEDMQTRFVKDYAVWQKAYDDSPDYSLFCVK